MFMVLVVAFVVASGCTDTETVPLANASPPVIASPLLVAATGSSTAVAGGGGAASARGSLFVADPLSNQVLRFNASDAGIDVTPQAAIVGPSTSFVNPSHLAMDSTRNILYVLDSGTILVFNSPKTLAGDVAPNRVFASVTGGAQSLALDEARDILYIGHTANRGITSYDQASTLVGSVTPNRSIVGANTQLQSVRGLFLDSGNRLFAADLTAPGVISFDNASAADGDIAPSRAIVGPTNTTFIDPFALAVDASATLFVSDPAARTTSLFVNAATATGDIAPTFSFLSTQTFGSNIRQFSLRDGATLFGANVEDPGISDAVILVFLTADLRNNIAAPIRQIRAPTAGMLQPTGVAHDPNR